MNSFSDKKKVSVIIPTYNRAKFLPDAVKSIIDQKYDNTEIIIVDDGSEDNTESVVNSLKNKYSNIMHCRNIRAKGPSGARNTGIIKASGDYVSFLDSDDIWLYGHLKNGLAVFNKHPQIDVLFGNFSVADYETGKFKYNFFDQKRVLHALESIQLSPGIKLLQDNLFEALIRENFFHMGSAIIRKSAINGIMMDEAITYAEDRDFAIQLYKKEGATFAYRTDPVFTLFMHNSSLYSTSLDKTQPILDSHIHLLKKYLKQYKLTNNEENLVKKYLAFKLSDTAYLYSKNKDYKNAFSSVLQSFHYNVSFAQIRDLMKVFMTFIYVPKSTHFKPVN